MTDRNMTWLGITEEEIFNGVVTRLGCNKATAEGLTKKIAAIDASLKPDFKKFWEIGSLTCSVERGEYNFALLIERWNMTPIGAFMTLDWLIREPEEADKSLRRGYDKIIFKEDVSTD